MGFGARAEAVLVRLHWRRGLRAGLAVAAAMIVCRLLKQPMGWAALGGFEAILVDSGGPYWSRLKTMATVLLGGAVACVLGSMAPQALLPAALMTASFCFLVIFGRVLAQPIAGTAVVILVIYFAGYGGPQHSFAGALQDAMQFVLGGVWATVLSLVLWPFDPFRPARLAVGECYGLLAEAAERIAATTAQKEERDWDGGADQEWKRRLRRGLEAARTALGATSAGAASRTVRARSLTVLLETADMMFALLVRMAEILEVAEQGPSRQAVVDSVHLVGRAMDAVRDGLWQRPPDGAASYAAEGSRSLERVRRQSVLRLERETAAKGSDGLMTHVLADEADALQNIEIAFEAVRAVWIGMEAKPRALPAESESGSGAKVAARSFLTSLQDAVAANWTLDSVMMRHALRVGAVAGVDVVLIRVLHLGHGFWLAMTSIIVLQPHGSQTLRRSVERVGGTIGGGILAAALAAAIQGEAGIIAVVTICSILTLATYAVDYAWFSFFLTPTFVLMSLPYLHDWRYAGVRMGMTVLGALVAVLAMRLLWPHREDVELGRLLERGAAADAAYVDAMLKYWAAPSEEKRVAERELLAPARRACGLASNDAEEALDRMMQEPGLGRRRDRTPEHVLTFTTYLRRLTQTITTLAIAGVETKEARLRMESLEGRLKRVGQVSAEDRDGLQVSVRTELRGVEGSGFVEQQMLRMEKQVGVLERAGEVMWTQR